MKKFLATMGIVSVSAIGSVQAALPTEVTDTLTALQVDGLAFIAAILAVIAALAGGIFGLRLVPVAVRKVASWLK